jgi:mono/diheme cytochrome c family protein
LASGSGFEEGEIAHHHRRHPARRTCRPSRHLRLHIFRSLRCGRNRSALAGDTLVLETARTRSIKAHAASIQAPSGLDDPAQILTGIEHFAAHCALCHGAPGVPKGDIGQGLYPPPPDLAKATQPYNPAELFWIVNGVKMTGMPAWADHSDEELWAVVAFIKKLPGISEQDYARLVMASVARGGPHHHGGSEEGRPAPTKPDDHEHH